jgi:hypothetical protein
MQMVNDGFPERDGYGFEMVDVRGASVLLRRIDINRKFTPNPITRIFRKFSAI